MATFYKYQERDLDSQVNYADIGLGISNLITDQLAVRKAKKEAYDDQVRAINQYLDERPIGDEDNVTDWTATYASQMQQKMLANQRAFKNGRVSERDNVIFMQNVQNGTKTMFDLSADYQAEYKDAMERMNAIDPANRSQLAETWMKEQFESFSNFKQTKPIINDKTGMVLLSKKNENGTFDVVSATDMATRIKAKYNYFDIDKNSTVAESAMGAFDTEWMATLAARGKQGLTIALTDKLDIANKAKFDQGLAKQVAIQLSIPNNTMSVLTNSIGGYTLTFSKEEAANDSKKILMVKKEGSTGPPQPDFTTVNGKKQQDEANLFYGDMIKSKIDYERKLSVVGAIQDKSADLTALGMGQLDLEAQGNIIAENYIAAFGSSDPSVAATAFSYLGGLNTNNQAYNTVNGKLQYQIGNKANEINIKNKSVYEITKSTMNANGVPSNIQKYVLDRVKALGGQSKFYNNNQDMKGFDFVGTKTANTINVTPVAGSAP
jgi:hypothetical protein